MKTITKTIIIAIVMITTTTAIVEGRKIESGRVSCQADRKKMKEKLINLLIAKIGQLTRTTRTTMSSATTSFWPPEYFLPENCGNCLKVQLSFLYSAFEFFFSAFAHT